MERPEVDGKPHKKFLCKNLHKEAGNGIFSCNVGDVSTI